MDTMGGGGEELARRDGRERIGSGAEMKGSEPALCRLPQAHVRRRQAAQQRGQRQRRFCTTHDVELSLQVHNLSRTV